MLQRKLMFILFQVPSEEKMCLPLTSALSEEGSMSFQDEQSNSLQEMHYLVILPWFI